MLFLSCTISSENLSAGQMLPLGTTGKDKALLSNPALIYLPPCSLGPTVELERCILVLVWSYNREGFAYLTVHSYADNINSRKVSRFLLLNTVSSVGITGLERKEEKNQFTFQKRKQKKLCAERNGHCILSVFREEAELNIIPRFSTTTRKLFLCENTSRSSWWFVTLCCNPGGTWNMTKGHY